MLSNRAFAALRELNLIKQELPLLEMHAQAAQLRPTEVLYSPPKWLFNGISVVEQISATTAATPNSYATRRDYARSISLRQPTDNER